MTTACVAKFKGVGWIALCNKHYYFNKRVLTYLLTYLLTF